MNDNERSRFECLPLGNRAIFTEIKNLSDDIYNTARRLLDEALELQLEIPVDLFTSYKLYLKGVL